jgi:RNA polymerase sigma-70 factor, ECF subfamily
MTDERTAAGAFERFFLDEHPKLVALGLAWTGHSDVARDLAQEAFTRAFRSWSTVELLDLPGAWVRRVMINLLIDHRRRAERDGKVAEEIGAPPAAPGPDPTGDAWWRAVRALPDRERAAVTLHYLEDLSVAAVAEILEVKPGTVKASLSHAREKLRTAPGSAA